MAMSAGYIYGYHFLRAVSGLRIGFSPVRDGTDFRNFLRGRHERRQDLLRKSVPSTGDICDCAQIPGREMSCLRLISLSSAFIAEPSA